MLWALSSSQIFVMHGLLAGSGSGYEKTFNNSHGRVDDPADARA